MQCKRRQPRVLALKELWRQLGPVVDKANRKSACKAVYGDAPAQDRDAAHIEGLPSAVGVNAVAAGADHEPVVAHLPQEAPATLKCIFGLADVDPRLAAQALH